MPVNVLVLTFSDSTLLVGYLACKEPAA